MNYNETSIKQTPSGPSEVSAKQRVSLNVCAVLCARLLGELWSRMTTIARDIGLIYRLLTAKSIDLSLLIDYGAYF